MEEDLDSLCREQMKSGAGCVETGLIYALSSTAAAAAAEGLQILCPVIMPQCKDKQYPFLEPEEILEGLQKA